jgi:hypothetical protein
MKLAFAIASIFAALASPAAAQSALDHSIGTAVSPVAGKPRRPPPNTEPRFLRSASPSGRSVKSLRPVVAIVEPPAIYVRPFAGPVIERVLPLNQARAACAKRGVRADACSWASKGSCYVVIPSAGAPVKNLAAYRRHETAHCNGWNH